MSGIQKILCPTDWSEPSRVALQAAVNMARYEKAELVLLHILPALGLVYGIASVAPLGQIIEQEAQQKLDALIAECVPSDIRVQSLIRIGEEATEIHRAALEVDVVVMSTHGRSSWAHWAFGSIAESVLHDSTCPVFVIGPTIGKGVQGESEQDGRESCFDFPFKQVLWPTDWSEPSELALDKAIVIAAHHQAELLLLHVLEPSHLPAFGSQHEQFAEAEAQFQSLHQRKPETKKLRHLVVRGIPAEEITRVSLSEGADLIVMSTHGRTGWQRLRLGSVAQTVVRQVPCPIFLVPQHAPITPIIEPSLS